MNTKPLIETNPYLEDEKARRKLVARSVRTSCGVEGIKEKSVKSLQFLISHRKDKKIYNTSKQ
jgi:hypothetical protein